MSVPHPTPEHTIKGSLTALAGKQFNVEQVVDQAQQEAALSTVRQEYDERMKQRIRPPTLDEVAEISGFTIVEDRTSKLITFLSYLLTYTHSGQMNIAFKSESSTGKSYITIETAQYFPEDDLCCYAYSSPTAFFHDRGSWDKESKVIHIDLSKKILIFLDQPHDLLLQRLRPLLSHDQETLTFKITDKTAKTGIRTKTVIITGYPTTVFCSASQSLDDQERTRLILLSPEASQKKLEKSLEMLAEKLANRIEFQEKLRQDPKREWLMHRVNDIKSASIDEILIENPKQILDDLKRERKHLRPRTQRDFPRLFALIKAHALLNFHSRQRIILEIKECIVANQDDVQAGFTLYNGILRANELGVSPETLEIHDKLFLPYEQGLTQSEIYEKYRAAFHRPLSYYRLTKNILPALQAAGLVEETQDPLDKRQKRYKPLEDIYATRGGGTIKKIECMRGPLYHNFPKNQEIPSPVVAHIVSEGEGSEQSEGYTCGKCVHFHKQSCIQERPLSISPVATYPRNCHKFERGHE